MDYFVLFSPFFEMNLLTLFLNGKALAVWRLILNSVEFHGVPIKVNFGLCLALFFIFCD